MTPSEPAVVLPSPAATPSFAERLRPAGSQLIVALGLGIAAEVFLDRAAGIGHALFAIIAGIAIATSGGRETWHRAKEHRWLLAAAVLLMSSSMLHTAEWLSAMTTLSSLLLFAIALQGWTGERPLHALRTGDVITAPIISSAHALYAGGAVTAHGLASAKISSTFARYAPAALRLMVIVFPPVLILLALLSSGDVVFRARLASIANAVFGVEVEGFIRGSLVIGTTAWFGAGALAITTRRRDGHVVTEPRRFMRHFEGLTLLGSLTALLLFFGLTSTPCALAPASCELPAGVTYADAAHEGFFQLLFAALGILVLLMALPARVQLESRATKLAFTALSTVLVLATMPMVISGVARLWRYETTYGLTVLRLLAYAGLFLVSAVLAWRAVTLWAFRNAFVGGAIALFTTTLLALAALSPDHFIATRNMSMQRPDYSYLLRLSDEALIPLVEQIDVSVDIDVRDDVRGELRRRALAISGSSGLDWNPSRAKADTALSVLR
ncbi:MAG: DUF4173 domain-containing protein [Archangium sp.]